MPRNDLIQLRSDTAANWASVNPTLAVGETGFETDTGKLKVGTGSTAWNSLIYVTDASDLAGIIPSARISGSYTGITGVGTVTAGDIAATLLSGFIASARISGSYTGITGVGILSAGTWNASVVAGQYGGTGVANTGKTITLGGNLTTSGAFTTTLTVGANTSLTLPSSGTVISTGNLSSITSVGNLSSPLAISAGTGVVIKAIENRLVSGTGQSAAMYLGDNSSGNTATGGIEVSWNTANNDPIIGIGVTRDSNNTKITMSYAGNIRFTTQGTERMSITNSAVSFANGINGTSGSFSSTVSASRFDVGGSYFNTTPQISGQGIAYTGATTGGGTANLMGIRWASPNIVGTIDNVASAVLGTVSDRRFKTNIETLQIGLATVKQLRPVTYNPLDVIGFDENNEIIIGDKDPYETVEGFIADEVEQVAPWLVQGGENGGYQSINYALITPMLVKAVQELDETIASLNERIKQLEESNS